MAVRYSEAMRARHPSLPVIWLVSDERTDAVLEATLARLPSGSGLIFRHYRLSPRKRVVKFRRLLRLCRRRGHLAIWAGTAREARALGADGCYGAPPRLAYGPGLLRLVTAHSLAEIGAASRSRASAILLSPVCPTRSHPGAKVLGPLRFLLLAARSLVPVIALGGMDPVTARRLPGVAWAAIDGLSRKRLEILKDS